MAIDSKKGRRKLPDRGGARMEGDQGRRPLGAPVFPDRPVSGPALKARIRPALRRILDPARVGGEEGGARRIPGEPAGPPHASAGKQPSNDAGGGPDGGAKGLSLRPARRGMAHRGGAQGDPVPERSGQGVPGRGARAGRGHFLGGFGGGGGRERLEVERHPEIRAWLAGLEQDQPNQ